MLSPFTMPMSGMSTFILLISLATLVVSNPLPALSPRRMSSTPKQLFSRGFCASNYDTCIGNNYCCPYPYMCVIQKTTSLIYCCTDLNCYYWQYPIVAQQAVPTSKAKTTTTSSYTPPTTTSSYYKPTTTYSSYYNTPSTTSSSSSYSYSYDYSDSTSSRYSYSSSSSSRTTSRSSTATSTPTAEPVNETTKPRGLSTSDKIALGVGIPSALGAIAGIWGCIAHFK